ncbi:MAG: RNA polymerase sigma factor [Candidatus Pacebacteria bacterium]|nr:RNA polymerase sigma factor [Candidatus Paceibacterota bacterium]
MSQAVFKKFKEDNLNSRAKRQDQEAFVELYSLYVDDVFRFVYFKLGHKEEAQDLTSSVFLKAWDYISKNSINKNKSLKALFYKIARNSIADYYRQSKGGEFSLDHESFDLKVSSQMDVSSEVEAKLELERVMKLLNNLKDDYKDIIILRHINELSWEEISQATGKSKGNLRVLLHRALKALEAEDEKSRNL